MQVIQNDMKGRKFTLIFAFFFFFSFSFLRPFLYDQKKAEAFPKKGSQVMMVAPSHYAIQAGKEIALQGGNVVDVAIAMALTISVTSPYIGSLGGGGFALVKLKKKPVTVVDFREEAPQATFSRFYLNRPEDSSIRGGAAVGIPGLPAGLFALHKKFGKLKWKKLFQKPLQLSEKGFQVSGDWARITKEQSQHFNEAGQKYFLKKGKRKSKGRKVKNFYKPGEIFKQKQLVFALKQFRDHNLKGFYEGPVASDIVQTITNTGGVLKKDDLIQYKVRFRKPLTTYFNGYKLYLMPPPSSGGLILKTALHLLETLHSKREWSNAWIPMGAGELHLLGEILSRAFRGRILLGDPDFQNQENLIEKLLSLSYLNQLKSSIFIDKTVKLPILKSSKDLDSQKAHFKRFSLNNLKAIEARAKREIKKGNTTHLSVLDKEGNSVAMTITLNGIYGSGVVTEKYGIALNNEMDDFNTRPGKPNMYGLIHGKANQVEPKKRPLSSMSPTLVEKNGKIILSAGGAGGPLIISGVFQLLYRTLLQKENVHRAIEMPRVHHQFLPHKLLVDRKLQPASLKQLKEKGHKVEIYSHIAWISAVRMNEEGELEASYESAREGSAGGY